MAQEREKMIPCARIGEICERIAITGEYDPSHSAHGATLEGECQTEEDEPLTRIDSIHDVVRAG